MEENFEKCYCYYFARQYMSHPRLQDEHRQSLIVSQISVLYLAV